MLLSINIFESHQKRCVLPIILMKKLLFIKLFNDLVSALI